MPCLRSWCENDVSGRPYFVTGRVTSWLDSTQVGGAPIGTWVDSVRSMDAFSSPASHGRDRKSKLNAVCISSGRKYSANRSWSGIHISPTRNRASYESVICRQPR